MVVFSPFIMGNGIMGEFVGLELPEIMHILSSSNKSGLTEGNELEFSLKSALLVTIVTLTKFLLVDKLLGPVQLLIITLTGFFIVFLTLKLLKVLNVLVEEKSLSALLLLGLVLFLLILF